MKRHVSIFTFLLGAVGLLAILPVSAAVDVIRVTPYGIYSPGSASLDKTKVAEYFSPSGDTSVYSRAPSETTFTVKNDTPGWGVEYWLGESSEPVHGEYAGTKISGTEGKATYALTADDFSKATSGVLFLAVKFRHIKYDLVYNSAGGTPTPTGETYSYDTQFQLAAAPSRTGYTFDGWLASSVAQTFAAGATVSGTSLCPDTWHEDNHKVTLTAQWTANTYDVTLDRQGGSGGTSSIVTTYDTAMPSATMPSREGWSFDGYFTKPQGEDGGTKYYNADGTSARNWTETSVSVLYARWTQKFSVTFREDEKFNDTTPGKDGILKIEYVLRGESATPPANPVHTGYRFTGWSGNQTDVVKNEDVNATYQANSYRVILHANDGSGVTSEESFVYGEAKALLPLARVGYVLAGWAESADSATVKYKPGEVVANLATGGEVHLYALWTPITYSVEFDSNGGEGTMKPLTPKYGESFTVPSNEFVRAGCEFRFWSAVINSVTTNFEAGATVSNLTANAGETVTFKAEWIGRYIVAFNGNGGEGTMTNLSYETGVEYALPSNAFTKTGYRFYGWATSEADADALKNPAYTNGQTVVDLAAPGETRTLYAEWTTNRYTVVFNPNGAGVKGTMEPQDFVYDQAQPLSECKFTRGELWSFVGWTNSAAGGPLYADQQVVSNLTAQADGRVELTAVWNSTLSPLALAMGCDNLNWTNETTTSVWKVGTVDFYGTDIPCVYASGSTEARMRSSNFTTNGVLKFWWKADGPREGLTFYVNEEVVDSWRLDDGEDPDYTNWHEANFPVNCKSDGGVAYFKISHREGDSTCWIAKMTWTPEGGSEHPVPTDADKVTISSAAVSDGKFTLTFPSKAEFNYNLLTNANLLIDSWGVMGTEEGTGGNVIFEPEIVEGQPQLFYKVETIQRK